MLKSFNFVTAVLLLTLSTACHGNVETAKRKYVESGDRYVAQGKYSEAVIQYVNAINKDPKFGEAHAKLADTYLAQGNMRDAVLEYVRAADLLPDQAAAQLKAGHVLLLGGLFEEARVRARRVLERDPSNVEALVLTGNALAGLKDLDEALSVLQHALDYDPERVGTYTTVGVLQLARGDSEEAEKSFQKALATSNGSAEAHLGLGNFYRAVGRKADAERELKRALDLDPKRVDANQALAGFYVETDRAPEAEPYLKAVVALSKDKSAAFALADYYTSQRRFDDAVRTLDELSSDPKQFMAARTRIAFVEFAAGNRPKAHEVIDDVLVREPRNALALTTKARLLLADGRTDLALERAKQAIDADSRSPQAQLTLGRVLVATNDPEGARRAFAESLRLEPNSLPPLLELVDLHQRRGQLDTATELADQAVRSHPANVAARLALVGVLTVRSEDHPRAQTELRWLLGRYPKSAPVRTAQGAYLLSERDLAGARDAFSRALELDPLDREALAGIVAVDLSTKNLADARDHVNGALARSPGSPTLLILLAKIEFTANNFGEGRGDASKGARERSGQPGAVRAAGAALRAARETRRREARVLGDRPTAAAIDRRADTAWACCATRRGTWRAHGRGGRPRYAWIRTPRPRPTTSRGSTRSSAPTSMRRSSSR